MINIKKWEARQEDDDFRGLSLDYAEQEIDDLRAALALTIYERDTALMEIHRVKASLVAPEGQAPVPEGYQLVSMEPTADMMNAGYDEFGFNLEAVQDFRRIYKAMLAAAPKAPT